MILRSEFFSAGRAPRLAFFLLLIQAVISACSPGSSSTSVTTAVFLNVELENNSTVLDNGMLQLFLNRKLEGNPTNWLCEMTLPLPDINNSCSSQAGWYDNDTKKGRLYLVINGIDASLDLNFKEINNVLASLDVDINDPNNALISGRARLANTQLMYSSHLYYANNDATQPPHTSLRVDLYNIYPGPWVGSTTPYDTGDLFVTPSSDPATTTLLGGGHRWSAATYASVYKRYGLVPIDNGYPQGLMGYVEYQDDYTNPDLVEGSYSWVLCNIIDPVATPDCKSTGIIAPYTLSFSLIDANRNPQAASTTEDLSKLYAFGVNPAVAADFKLTNGAATLFNSLSIDPAAATNVGAGPYTLTWTSQVQNPTLVDWQVIFIPVDNAGNVDSTRLELRSPRLHDTELGGPAYNSTDGTYSWNLDPGFNLSGSSIVKVVLRVTNSSRIFSADTQAFYICNSAC